MAFSNRFQAKQTGAATDASHRIVEAEGCIAHQLSHIYQADTTAGATVTHLVICMRKACRGASSTCCARVYATQVLTTSGSHVAGPPRHSVVAPAPTPSPPFSIDHMHRAHTYIHTRMCSSHNSTEVLDRNTSAPAGGRPAVSLAPLLLY